MGAVVSYKCPNCGGDLQFSPEKQKFACEFCGSDFTLEQLKEIYPEDAGAPEAEAGPQVGPTSPEQQEDPEFDAHAVEFECPNCGAQIVTSDTTAATECFYCHNPVVLKGRLSGKMRPDLVIPFAVSRDDMKSRFKKWLDKKWFLNHHFLQEMVLDKVQGIYIPFWLANGTCNGGFKATATRTREWRSSDTIYTEHKEYEVIREGTAHFTDVPQIGLTKVDQGTINGIWPYHTKEAQPFEMSYLSGFVAEKYNRTKEEVYPAFEQDVKDYTIEMLRDTTESYNTFHIDHSYGNITESQWKYALFPAWVLHITYRGKPYHFAINGQTGEVYGILPLSVGRLAALFGAVGGILLVLMTILGGILG